jgi:integrase
LDKKLRGNGKNRRSLKFIEAFLSPDQIWDQLMVSKGFPYKTNMQNYLLRDRALVSCLYVLALRVSEATRLVRGQFTIGKKEILVTGIKLSKSRKAGIPRRTLFRKEAWIPLEGERARFGELVRDYLGSLGSEDRLFPIGTSSAYRRVIALTGLPPHHFRAFGENYLYMNWGNDPIAVCDYVCITSVRVLAEYLRGSFRRYSRV